MGRIIVAAFVAVFIAAVAAIIGVPVVAQEAPAAPPPGAYRAPPSSIATSGTQPDVPASRRTPMAQLDTDHDGRISKAEWLAGGRKERGFDRIDTDHDGYLSADELAAARERMTAMRAARSAEPQ